MSKDGKVLDGPHQDDDAIPLSRKGDSRLVARCRLQQALPVEADEDTSERDGGTLESLCRAVVSDHLERYPPEAMGMLSEVDWESIVTCRHHRKAPKEGTGGLDGTGRVAPAISSKYLAAVEQTNAHLAESAVVDELVWKDCVNFKFKLNSPSRPLALTFPWPVLLQQIQSASEQLEEVRRNYQYQEISPSSWTEEEEHDVSEAIQIFQKSPMSVSLLKTTGVGKVVKKFIKSFSNRKKSESPSFLERSLATLEELLKSWMDLASRGGVLIHKSESNVAKLSSHVDDDREETEEEDLKLAESCSTWRALFMALEDRESKRRASQGARMREKRRKLDSDRPKIVKVRPSRSKHDSILDRLGTRISSSNGTPNKLQQIKRETLIMASRKEGIPLAKTKSGGAFGAAVALAFGTKKNANKRKPTTSVDLAGGKRMNVPQRNHLHGPAALAKPKPSAVKHAPPHRR